MVHNGCEWAKDKMRKGFVDHCEKSGFSLDSKRNVTKGI